MPRYVIDLVHLAFFHARRMAVGLRRAWAHAKAISEQQFHCRVNGRTRCLRRELEFSDNQMHIDASVLKLERAARKRQTY